MKHMLLGLALAALAAVAPAAAATPKPQFPVTVTSGSGQLTIPRQPKRIVSLSPTATESLYAIGAGKQVVAVDEQSDYPAGTPRTKIQYYKPNAEAVAGYRPDLVVVRADVNGIVGALAALRIPVLVQPEARHLNEAWAQIRRLGKATGHEREATALATRLKAQVRRIVAGVPKGREVSMYHELTPDFYSASSNTFIGRIYRLFGLRNIADAADRTGSGYPQLSPEYIVSAGPDLVFLADSKCCDANPQTVAARPGWSQVPAVRNGNVIPLDDDVASRWGPRVVQFIDAVGRAVTAARR